MRAHTDSATIVHHEDGSWTETTETTHYPATKQEKATAYFVLAAVMAAPFVPLLTVISLEKASQMRAEYRAKREAKKLEKK